ncbi:MAG: hypothetical protein AB1297_02625 [bacterium]
MKVLRILGFGLMTLMANQGRAAEILWPSGPIYDWPFWRPVHQKITEKACNLLNIQELNLYKDKIKHGTSWDGEDFGDGIIFYKRSNNHSYNPRTGKGKYDPSSGKHRASALGWAMGTQKDEVEDVENEYTWNHALGSYTQGHKVGAYERLGHVVHLLQDVAMPSHVLCPRLSDLDKNNADIGLEEKKYEQNYAGDNYQNFLDDATQITW